MAWNTVILQADLDSAGIPDANLSARLVGMTVAAAANVLETIMALRAVGQIIDNGGMISYAINGQQTGFSTAAVEAALVMIRKLKNRGGGAGILGLEMS